MTGTPWSTGTVALVLLAGASLSLEILILSAMVARGLGQITALALNSAVGLVLLVGVNLALLGPGVVLLRGAGLALVVHRAGPPRHLRRLRLANRLHEGRSGDADGRPDRRAGAHRARAGPRRPHRAAGGVDACRMGGHRPLCRRRRTVPLREEFLRRGRCPDCACRRPISNTFQGNRRPWPGTIHENSTAGFAATPRHLSRRHRRCRRVAGRLRQPTAGALDRR